MHQALQTKKLVLVLTTSTLVTGAKKAQEMILHQASCIYFLKQFWEEK